MTRTPAHEVDPRHDGVIHRPLTRLLRRLGAESAGLWLADRIQLRRSQEGRVAFPYVIRSRQRRFHILSYHRVTDAPLRFFPGVSPARFRRQMETVARCSRVLPLGELILRMRAGDIPPRSTAITFDDGYRDNYEHAFPVLRELDLPATIFLATGPLDTGKPLWHDRVFHAFENAGDAPLEISGQSLAMGSMHARGRTLQEVLGVVRSLTPVERDRVIERIETQAHVDGASLAADLMLSWEQVREMSSHGITFGAHTVSHPILTRMPIGEARTEIRESRDSIERQLGVSADLFAYPNGTRADFSGAIQDLLREEGFRAAATTIWGSNHADSDPLELKRIGFWNSDPELIPLRMAWYRFGE